LSQLQQNLSVETGEDIVIIKKDRQINILHNGWLPAAQRVALGIQIHPDQMTRDDWVALPGIGDVLADRIEIDRQINGDYGSVDALIRVKGIGKKRLEKWVDFF
jgi:competence protein ComEA